MKLSKLYTNKSEIFKPIIFSPGLNVVLAEIRDPKNLNKDTHNLGKSTLGRLLDFTLLAGKNANLFLFRHKDIFSTFIFFLEIELDSGSFITIRRSVKEASKISFKQHDSSNQDYSDLAPQKWNHWNIVFEQAKRILDGLLDWRSLNPWSFRMILGYLLRSQDDFRDVFQLGKFSGKHAEWKPFLAHLLGFNAQEISDLYDKENQVEEKRKAVNVLRRELINPLEDIGKIEGLILLKQKDIEEKQAFLDSFDFSNIDKESTNQLVNELDQHIAELNSRRYTLRINRKRIQESLQEGQILFNIKEAQQLFNEAGILFQGQIKKDFQQLIEFNRAITDERRCYLQEENADIEQELKYINDELAQLAKKRSVTLSFLSEMDVFIKYRETSAALSTLRADIKVLEHQRTQLQHLQQLRTEYRQLQEECSHLKTSIEADVNKRNADSGSLFSAIRIFFNEIIEEVLDRKALLSVEVNKQGHLDFKVEVLDETGNRTSADLGHSYRKLLCIAFDLAILRAHAHEPFPRFVFHDGVLESLDNRKKENLLAVIRRYAAFGLQPIITLIDSDLSALPEGSLSHFSEDEIILSLHDMDNNGRLFKIEEW